MSYLPRQHPRRHVAIVAVVIGLVSTACSGSDAPTTSAPASAPASPIELASPTEFSTFLDDNPDVPLINVHIPYEQHIEGTDAFIAFDSILESDDLPTDRSAPIAL